MTKEANYLELIDNNMCFVIALNDEKNNTITSLHEMAREEFEVENEVRISGSDIVKVAKIFGIDADEKDIVGKNYGKRAAIFAGDIEIPIWKAYPYKTECQKLLVSISESGVLDVEVVFSATDIQKITYNGRFYIEWS